MENIYHQSWLRKLNNNDITKLKDACNVINNIPEAINIITEASKQHIKYIDDNNVINNSEHIVYTLTSRINELEKDNQELKKDYQELKTNIDNKMSELKNLYNTFCNKDKNIVRAVLNIIDSDIVNNSHVYIYINNGKLINDTQEYISSILNNIISVSIINNPDELLNSNEDVFLLYIVTCLSDKIEGSINIHHINDLSKKLHNKIIVILSRFCSINNQPSPICVFDLDCTSLMLYHLDSSYRKNHQHNIKSTKEIFNKISKDLSIDLNHKNNNNINQCNIH